MVHVGSCADIFSTRTESNVIPRKPINDILKPVLYLDLDVIDIEANER